MGGSFSRRSVWVDQQIPFRLGNVAPLVFDVAEFNLRRADGCCNRAMKRCCLKANGRQCGAWRVRAGKAHGVRSICASSGCLKTHSFS